MGKAKELIRSEVTQRKQRHFHAHETARFDQLSGLPLASFKQRAYAMCIDLVLIAILRWVLHLTGNHRDDFDGPVTVMSLAVDAVHWLKELAESVLYFGVLVKVGKGQTPGKFLMKARVVSLTHPEMGWWQSIERALGYGASLLEGGFGFFQYFMSRNRQCVHDRIAETIVVDVRKGAKRLQDEATEKVEAPYA